MWGFTVSEALKVIEEKFVRVSQVISLYLSRKQLTLKSLFSAPTCVSGFEYMP